MNIKFKNRKNSKTTQSQQVRHSKPPLQMAAQDGVNTTKVEDSSRSLGRKTQTPGPIKP
jgi:hypothetical protein